MNTNPLPSLGVKRIDHITLVVKDLEATARFYRDVLGMAQVDRPAFSFPGGWFQIGPTLVHTILANEDSGQPGFPFQGAKRRSRGFHFAFEVEDCDAAAKQLISHGLSIDSGPKSRPDGARQVFVLDPDGHQIEIYSEPPAEN